jgi:hypothetical protein
MTKEYKVYIPSPSASMDGSEPGFGPVDPSPSSSSSLDEAIIPLMIMMMMMFIQQNNYKRRVIKDLFSTRTTLKGINTNNMN